MNSLVCVVSTILLVPLSAMNLTAPPPSPGLGLVPRFSNGGMMSGAGSVAPLPKPECSFHCPQGYLPGTCLCQDSLFPFIFTSTPCKFTYCREGEVCRMTEGKAICVVVFVDRPSVDVCNLPLDPGPCNEYNQRYYFDKKDGQCKNFIYSGCRGNDNNFMTKYECEDTCIAHVPVGGSKPGSLSRPGHQTQTHPDGISKEICQLPAESGPCFAHFQNYFFNARTGKCEQFVYGGCSGNKNRFKTVQACERACIGDAENSLIGSEAGTGSVAAPSSQSAPGKYPSKTSQCNMPKAEGLCLAYFLSYFYNTQTGMCEKFIYGGCQGNDNRFETKAQCEVKCISTGPDSVVMPRPTRPNLHPACLQPKAEGRCRAHVQRWYFDEDTMTCRVFYYGGCWGNNNNFGSKTECERRCQPHLSAVQSTGSAASVVAIGDNASGSGGSGDTVSQPQQSGRTDTRPSLCSKPKVIGRCRARIPKYYFNPDTSHCEMFFYGGCGGNENRFDSSAQCRATCSGHTDVIQPHTTAIRDPHFIHTVHPLHNTNNNNVCTQPRLEGSCHSQIPRFYYNSRSGQCEAFIYRGCGGNGNNFRSREACERRCNHHPLLTGIRPSLF